MYTSYKKTVQEHIMPKKLTNLQKNKRLKRSRRDTRVRKLRNHPLCITKRFIEYALRQEWDDLMVDAAALIMHYYFMNLKRIKRRGWIPIPHQIFENMFGRKYSTIKQRLLASGFLQYNHQRKYKAGSHCSEYRICDELRNDRVSASYHLKSEQLQQRYIAHKEYLKRLKNLPVKEYQNWVNNTIKSAFARTDSHSYYRLVERGYLTEEQFQTIKRLASNAHKLKLLINEDTVIKIATERHNRKAKDTANYDLDAYIQWIQAKVESTSIPRISICRNGRFYVPVTNLPRELWNHVFLGEHQLAGVDTKNSHVVCLLALLKDISLHYFGTTGTYEERLTQCQFSKQIRMIPGLKEHLRISGIFYQPHYVTTNTVDTINKSNPFVTFTRYYFAIMKNDLPY